MASTIDRFWQALESVPGCAAVMAEWKLAAGRDFLVLGPLLRPRQELARSYPCTDPTGGCGCTHEVVVHDQHDMVAVCRCESPWCKPFAIAREDLVIYDLDTVALGKKVARALNVKALQVPVDGLFETRRIGAVKHGKTSVPVFLTIQHEQADMSRVVEALLAQSKQALCLLAPTDGLLSSHCLDLLQQRDGFFVPLHEILEVEKRNRLLSRTSLAQLLLDGLSSPARLPEHVPESFPTPEGATWEDLVIQFVDGHTVSIAIKGKRGRYNYTQMGMVDRRNSNPTVQWELLGHFARERGELTWQSAHAHRRWQKQCENLSANLKQFFGLSDQPIRYSPDLKGWVTRFQILPE